ncbi:hypothetical protein [Syntrophomonas wolfei]|uniref:hypothetical protein n=1 Tax=Syntrophomonas wolfei TaxID=863 RepID=UPI0007738243|nr:hypothetical protein [Syntrophomonas wolfei]
MQINGYSSATMLAYRSSDMQRKVGLPQTNSFAQTIENTAATEKATKTTETTGVSAADEMATFKKEIYDELEQINGMNSSSILSNSVHITEDGFQRMKDDPEYRKEIMDWLRADARASHGVPFDVHVTTNITGSGATCYGANVYHDDNVMTKSSKKQLADKKAEGAFYRSERKSHREDNSKLWIKEREKRDRLQKMLLEKSINQKIQRQAMNEEYINNYIDNL